MSLQTRVGIDLAQISQVAASLEKFGEAYMKRIFTPAEISYCSQSPLIAAARFAARFAAKEAALKALQLEDQALDLKSFEVTLTPGGACVLALHGEARRLADAAGWSSWSLSMTHEGDYAMAVVMVLVTGRGESR